jgi:hypothetical protein
MAQTIAEFNDLFIIQGSFSFAISGAAIFLFDTDQIVRVNNTRKNLRHPLILLLFYNQAKIRWRGS